MACIVQKFGGSSVANPNRIRGVAQRIADSYQKGDQVIVVLSAMGGVTDALIALAREITSLPTAREMDMLLATGEQTTIALMAMALHALGVPAISLTGAQAGILTDGIHTKARIQNITPKQIHSMLDAGRVVIVAGFQGQTLDGHITTLGRGGSDLTAIAIAAAVKADLCQIYTDVEGVFTTDPRLVLGAKKLPEITYDEMIELASAGAQVMQSRSVEFAKKFGVPFEVRSSLSQNPGTLVREETANMENVIVRGVSLDKHQAKITLLGVPDRPGIASRIFRALSDAAVNVDMIVQNVGHGINPTTDLSFTVARSELVKSQKVIESLREEVGLSEIISQEEMGKLSVVGVGMKGHSGIAAKLFEVLSEQSINIDMISTSEIKISVVISLAEAEKALRAVHDAFIG